MAVAYLPAPEEIRSVVEEEIRDAGGEIQDCLPAHDQLFLRAVLPLAHEPRPNDTLQAGVAVLASDEEICVHPFTFREVCRNGAIMAETVDSRKIERVGLGASNDDIEEVLSEVRQVVCECAQPEVFTRVAKRLDAATRHRADLALQLLPFMARLPESQAVRLLPAIVGQFKQAGDETAYGLMNAVTRVARDEADPRRRWDLEELGGGIPARLNTTPKPSDSAVEVFHTVFAS